jgi:hypothetical protein
MNAAPPLFHVIQDFATPALHAEVWQACMAKRWYYGNQSEGGRRAIPFWKMDLDGVEPVQRLWQGARAGCERLAGRALRVARAYANGHTYGLGGQPHVDDDREGTYTLLYYPMPEWLPEWEGETLFFTPQGDIAAGVRPQPNRALLFDARIPHAGRAPGRACPMLRVTVALKLEPAA